MASKTHHKASAPVRRRHLLGLSSIEGAAPAPYPGFIEPCQPLQKDRATEIGGWIHEIKHDGFRMQAHVRQGTTALYTRRGHDWSDKFSSIAEQVKKLLHADLILDGEVIVQNERGISDFYELQKDIAAGRTDRLLYMVFDVLYVDGVDLREVPLISRRVVLTQVLATSSVTERIRLSAHIEAEGQAVFEQACAMKLEGIVSKKRDSLYQSGEQISWIKVKCVKTDTFPIVAFVENSAPLRGALHLSIWVVGKATSCSMQGRLRPASNMTHCMSFASVWIRTSEKRRPFLFLSKSPKPRG